MDLYKRIICVYLLSLYILTVSAIDFQPIYVTYNESFVNSRIVVSNKSTVIADQWFTSASSNTSQVVYVTNITGTYAYDMVYNYSVAVNSSGGWRWIDNSSLGYFSRSSRMRNLTLFDDMTVSPNYYMEFALIDGVTTVKVNSPMAGSAGQTFWDGGIWLVSAYGNQNYFGFSDDIYQTNAAYVARGDIFGGSAEDMIIASVSGNTYLGSYPPTLGTTFVNNLSATSDVIVGNNIHMKTGYMYLNASDGDFPWWNNGTTIKRMVT